MKFFFFYLCQVGIHRKFIHSSTLSGSGSSWSAILSQVYDGNTPYTQHPSICIQCVCVRDAPAYEDIMWIEQICSIHKEIQVQIGGTLFLFFLFFLCFACQNGSHLIAHQDWHPKGQTHTEKKKLNYWKKICHKLTLSKMITSQNLTACVSNHALYTTSSHYMQ